MIAATGIVRADDAAVKKELLAVFAKFTAALKKKDVAGAMSYFTPDYTAKQMGMTMTRAQAEQQMKQTIGSIKSFDTISWDIKKVTVKGNTVIAEGTELFVGTIQDDMGQMGPKGKTHKLKDVENNRDTFVKTPKGWLLKSSETISAEISVDGKKVGPPAK